MPPPAPPRLPWRRPAQGRRLAGVAVGLAVHLGISVRLVRVIFVVLTPVLGVGPLLYLFWWLTVPEGDPADAAEAARPAALGRLARRQGADGNATRLPVTDVVVGALLMAGAAALLLARNQGGLSLQWVLPAMLVAAGLVLAWSQLDAVQRGRLRERAGGRVPVSVLRLAIDIQLRPDGTATIVQHRRASPASRAAASQVGQFGIGFNPTLQRLDVTEAYTLKRGGDRVDADLGQIRTQLAPGVPNAPIFRDIQQKVVIFPDLAENDVAVLTYRVKQSVAPRGSQEKATTQEMVDSSTWVRKEDQWQCVAHTETPLQQSPQRKH